MRRLMTASSGSLLLLCVWMCKYVCSMCVFVVQRHNVMNCATHLTEQYLTESSARVIRRLLLCTPPALSLSGPLQTKWALTAMALLAKAKADHCQSSLRLRLHRSTGWRGEYYSVLVVTSNSGLAGLGPDSRQTAKQYGLDSLDQMDILKLCLVDPFCPLSLVPPSSPPVNPPLVPPSVSSFRFTSVLSIYESWCNPNAVSLLITSICPGICFLCSTCLYNPGHPPLA